eukprot:TRINITY_DN25624_c0_g2_i1.p1 TRINITY_DN25624_c0_g2~~TRINITY_DN25624_c0_g2_i1.p1  ORF type:complete len:677 (+),score=144.95 TRINITY_DN25624_c0_g2_i1:33-2033(+)
MSRAPVQNSVGDILWTDLEVAIGGQVLLHPSTGAARAGRLLGILGPSGAGKSTLLGALAGVLPAAFDVRGRICGTGGLRDIGVEAGTVALLEQQHPFVEELTVAETLRFAAELEGLPPDIAARDAAVLLGRVGLASVAHRRVGRLRVDSSGTNTWSWRHSSWSAITGGERRRLAVACAIVGEDVARSRGSSGGLADGASQALLADEPTTGLDAFQALRVVGLLRELAIARRRVAVATLHQPRASIWQLLDDVVLVAPGGRVIYAGAKEDVLATFATLGHACPSEGVNPAEFIVDLVSLDAEDAVAAAAARGRAVALAAAAAAAAAKLEALEGGTAAAHYVGGACRSNRHAASSVRVFFLLVGRTLRQVLRDDVTNGLRLAATFGLAAIFGAHFGRLDGGGLPTARSVASRICLLSFGVVAMSLLALARALESFAREKAIVSRERTSRRYDGCVYLASKALVELPLDAACASIFAAAMHRFCALHGDFGAIVGTFALVTVTFATLGLAVGASVPRGHQAITVGAPIMMVHMLTGVIDPAGTAAREPFAGMQLLRSFSPVRHAIEALCIAELKGMRLARNAADAPRMGGLALVQSGDEVLRRLDIFGTFESCIMRLIVLAVLHFCAAALALTLTRPRFAYPKMGWRSARIPHVVVVPVSTEQSRRKAG